jgi:hypothetical protein
MREPARSGCPINMAVEAFGPRHPRATPCARRTLTGSGHARKRI